MIEIERKFLVTSNAFIEEAFKQSFIAQGYLNSDPVRNVRIRIKGDKGFITVKGKGNNNNTTRFEWEKEISLIEAQSLIKLCEKGVIEKTRYEVSYGNHVFEIDIFHGDNKGLIIAEVELQSEDEFFEKPKWLGKEVTNDLRYYNVNLCKQPFINW
jgi:adenylate cyclase